MKPTISIITSIYKGELFIERFFTSVSNQTIFKKCELIIILNEGSIKEISLIENFQRIFPDQVTLFNISPKEPLSASWNRGVKISNGEFIALWNVDDLRVKDSLENQVKTLINDPRACLTYGDFIEIKSGIDNKGIQFITPEFNPIIFSKRFASGGAFLVFRSSIFNQCGYFDEQIEIASDFDFILRLVKLGHIFNKTQGVLGYFWNNNTGLSTKVNFRNIEIEQNIIHRRYGNFDKLIWEHLKELKKINPANFLFFKQYIPITQYGLIFENINYGSFNQKLFFL
jgi:glycosyltransferase involved in cell wall biosynthesis